MKYIVATVDEIKPGQRKIVAVARRSIGIFNLGGEFFALRNNCPHQGAPLCLGKTWGAVRSSVPGEFDYTAGGEILSCPHHGWEFHIRTGQSWCEPERLRTSGYAVEVEDGNELLDLDAEGVRRVKGPYVAESVEVRVEDKYVVLDLA
jgi:nitrite reductase/ring-hydroxylating ferredoxin subunit